MLAEVILSCLVSPPLLSPIVSPRPPAASFLPFDRPESVAACLENPSNSTTDDGHDVPSVTPPVRPAAKPSQPSGGVQWGKLAIDSMRFLAVMHAFRYATEAGTRSGGVGLDSGYLRSVGNLHGWADGDPFYVNYVGHPMQGAVSGRLFLLNDPRFDRTEFGQDPEYWKGMLRAAAFAWAFSEQFEIGPISEASIGHIQADFPQQGFVDHVITPSIGLAWMLAEDAMDRYVIRALEDRITNGYLRIALRGGLNPARSFANLMDGRAPWARTSRSGIWIYRGDPSRKNAEYAARIGPPPEPKPAPFEFSLTSSNWQFAEKPCLGGGGEAAFRVAATLQMVLDVNGCKFLGLPTNVSGDALVYQIGPRWTPLPTGKWSPYVHVLFGGVKITEEQFYPDKKAAVEAANKNIDPNLAYTLHDQYTSQQESSGLAMTAGAGVDYKLSEAIAFRVLRLEYLRSTVGTVNGVPFNSGFQLATGMVLRLGTW